MRSNPIQVLSDVIAQAKYVHLSDMVYKQKQWVEPKKHNKDIFKTVKRRPLDNEIEVVTMFLQTFGNTSCGHGGVAGQSITDAYVICITSYTNEGLIYSNGRLYRKYDLCDSTGRERFWEIVNNRAINDS